MGSKNSVSIPKPGDDIKKSTNDFISATYEIININSKFTDIKKNKIEYSIIEDLDFLKKIIRESEFNHLSVGILGRSVMQQKFVNILYQSNICNMHTNTFISSLNKNKLNSNNLINILDEGTKNSCEKILSHTLKSTKSVNSNIKFTKYLTSNIVTDNLSVISSSKLSTIHDEFNLEIEFDELIKHLLFAIINDILIYIPDTSNLKNEISYLDFISDNMLILNLLKRNKMYIILDKKGVKNEKIQALVNKLGKTIVQELDYEEAEVDKIKFLGSMIEKNGDTYLGNATKEEIIYIKNKFNKVLENDEYFKYSKQKDEEEKQENDKVKLDPQYKPKKIEKLSFHEYKIIFVNNMSSTFSSSSNIENIEENLFQSLIKILIGKINLVRSNISYKLMIYQNYSEIESNNDFMNYMIVLRNEMIEEMNNGFDKIRKIFKSEQNNLLNLCESILTTSIKNQNETVELNYSSSFSDIFNISGNFIPFNDYIQKVRKSYYSFNMETFKILSSISKSSFKILEMLSKSISNKYSNIFLELEKKMIDGELIENLRLNYGNLQIEELIKLKLERINTLAIHLLSIFAYTNFNFNKVTPWYSLFSYGGVTASILSFFIAFYSKHKIAWNVFGISIFGLGCIISNVMKNHYISESKDHYVRNVNNLISFITLKKDSIVNFEVVLKKNYEIYSKETIELIDLITQLN